MLTPAARGSRSGNRATAERWRLRLRELGHAVRVRSAWQGEDCDLLLAIHAWRSAPSIRAFSERYPDRPLVVLLAGTDIYHFQHSDPETFRDSLRRAHALIGLHTQVAADIPAEMRPRLGIVLQSAQAPLKRQLPPLATRFEACVVGHLREEKDSLRAALRGARSAAGIAPRRDPARPCPRATTGLTLLARRWRAIGAIAGGASGPPPRCAGSWRAPG